MKVELVKKMTYEVKYLLVKAGARYWEDSDVNGVEDTEGTLIPFRKGDYWCPKIDMDEGRIVDWPEGMTADIHYKVCDDGKYTLTDAEGNVIAIDKGYVPDFLSPAGDPGYGDYIIMQVDGTGMILEWRKKIDLSMFGDDE